VAYVSGRKGIGWHRFRDRPMAAEWSGFSDTPAHRHATEITAVLMDAFARDAADGGVDEIHLVHTEFVSMLTQRPVLRRLLPLEIRETSDERPAGPLPIYEFEPSPERVLDELLPWYVESRIFHALLDSAAAEIAARRKAMKSATDNANDLLEALTREANKARQAEITQEISEIVGGANALADATSGSE
jgi:F-type H+-transporting ATPase subunit gamma